MGNDSYRRTAIGSARDVESRLTALEARLGRTAAKATVNLADGFGGTVSWSFGAGSPEGVVTATQGSLFTRTDGDAVTTLYVKTSGAGNTGWTAK